MTGSGLLTGGSRLLNWWLKAAQRLLVTLLVVVAVTLLAGRLLTWLIPYYQPEIESFLLHALSDSSQSESQPPEVLTALSIGQISGGWQGFDLRFHIDALHLSGADPDMSLADTDHAGKTLNSLLAVGAFTVRLDTIRSLLGWQPVIVELEASGVRLTLVKDEAGRFRVRGLPGAERDDDERGGLENAWQYLTDLMPHLEMVRFRDIDITLLDQARGADRDIEYHIRSDDDVPLNVSAGQGKTGVSLPLFVEQVRRTAGSLQVISATRVWLTGEYRGRVGAPDFYASLYLDLPDMAVVPFLPRMALMNRTLTAARLSAEVWVKAEAGRVDVTGNLAVRDVRLGGESGEARLLDSATTAFRYQSHADNLSHGWLTSLFTGEGSDLFSGSAALPALHLALGNARLELNNIKAALRVRDSFRGDSDDAPQIAVSLPRLELIQVESMVKAWAKQGLVSGRFGTGFSKVNLRGGLSDLSFTARLDGRHATLVSLIDGVAMDAYLGIPAVSRIDGLLSLGTHSGYVDINNDRFDMNFSELFHHAWSFTGGRGRISYERQSLDDSLTISSNLLELVNDGETARGKVVIKLPPDKKDQTWGLIIGVTGAELVQGKRYIPSVLPETLIDWLNASVQGGTDASSALVFHGALNRDAPTRQKAFDAWFKVDDATLNFHNLWPPLHGLSARVHASNYAVTARDATGRIYDSEVPSASVQVPINAPRDRWHWWRGWRGGKVSNVLVTATASGPFDDVLRLFRETPLADTAGKATKTWSANGSINTELALNIRPGTGEPISADVRAAWRNAHLIMPELNLEVARFTGSVNYREDRGLHAGEFSGVLLGQPVNGRIDSQLHGKGGEVSVMVEGSVDMADLYQWSDQMLLSRASGIADYDLTVHVPYGGEKDQTYVEATTDLQGVILNLPTPMGKSVPEESRQFDYRQTFLTSGHRLDMQLGASPVDGRLIASLNMKDSIVTGGQIHFGDEPMGVVTYDAVRLTGELTRLDIGRWQGAADELSKLSDVASIAELTGHFHSAALDISRLTLSKLTLEDIKVRVTRQDASWVGQVNNELLGGEIRIPDDGPPKIDLEFLRFRDDTDDSPPAPGQDSRQADSQESPPEDPLVNVNPLDVIDFDFSTKLFRLNDSDLGSWAFAYRVRDEVAHLENLSASLIGIEILPTSTLTWAVNEGEHVSHFKGDVESSDLAHAMEKLGLASSIEGRDLELAADLTWPGSPATFEMKQLQGTVDIKKGKGRFVQADQGSALKLLGIFDFAQLGRRLRLDFSDVVKKGFEFNDIEGSVALDEGMMTVTEPLVISGPGGRFKIAGSINLNTRVLDNDMIVTLPVSKTLPWYAAYSAIATGPLTGLGILLLRKLFGKQIDRLSSAKYKIGGTIEEPDIKFVSIFSDEVRESPVAATDTE